MPRPKGFICSPETRAKMSAAHKGRTYKPHTPEAKAKISAAGKGRKPSAKARARMSAAAKRRHRLKVSAIIARLDAIEDRLDRLEAGAGENGEPKQ